jgi:hypothetical protein
MVVVYIHGEENEILALVLQNLSSDEVIEKLLLLDTQASGS